MNAFGEITGTNVSVSATNPDLSDALRRVALTAPDAIAMVDYPRSELTYAEWNRRADAVAHWLADRTAPRSVVLFYGVEHRGVDAAAAILGSIKAGCMAVPMSSRFSRGEVAAAIERLGVAAIIHGNTAGWLDHSEDIPFAELRDVISSEAPPDGGTRATRDGGCLVYTSGTTGAAQAVMCSHANLSLYLGWRPGFAERGLLHGFPYDTTPGVFLSVVAETRGPVIRVPTLDFVSFRNALEEYQPEDLMVVPVQMRMVLERARELDLPSCEKVRSVVMTSAMADERLIEGVRNLFPSATVSNCYGSSEAGFAATNLIYPPAGRGAAKTPPCTTPETIAGATCVGYPNDHTIATIRDESGAECEAGTPGEIWLSALGVPQRTYYGATDVELARKFSDGWIRMGDTGVIDSTGALHLLGRHEEIIDRGGINVAAPQIEAVLRGHPAVSDAAVFGTHGKKLGQEIVAAVVVDAEVSADDLKRLVRSELGELRVPDHVSFVRALPRNSLGKVLKRDLRDALEMASGQAWES